MCCDSRSGTASKVFYPIANNQTAMPYKNTKPILMAPDLTPVTDAYAPGKPYRRLAVTPRKLKHFPFRNRPRNTKTT